MLEILISRISGVSATKPGEVESDYVDNYRGNSLQNNTAKISEFEYTAIEQSWKLTRTLCGPEALKLYEDHKMASRLIVSLFRVFEVGATGNFVHFRMVFFHACQNTPDLVGIVMNSNLIIQMLYRIVHPEIVDCLVVLFILVQMRKTHQERQVIFEQLVDADFITILTTKISTLPTNASQQQSVFAAIECFKRIWKVTSGIPESYIMYLAILGDKSPVNKIVQNLIDFETPNPIKCAYIDLIHHCLQDV